MTDTPEPEDQNMQAAEYALGLLDPAEARAFEAAMARDPALGEAYAGWTEDFAALAAAADPAPPPADTFALVEARLFPEEKESWIRRLGLIPAVLGALVAALMVLLATNLGFLSAPPPGLSGQIAAAGDTLVVTARLEVETGVLVLEREAGAIANGRTQQLWLIVGDAAPVSLGLLAAMSETRLVLTAEALAALDGAVLAISDEPPGGSPTGQPTGAVLARGAMVRG